MIFNICCKHNHKTNFNHLVTTQKKNGAINFISSFLTHIYFTNDTKKKIHLLIIISAQIEKIN